MQPDPNFTIIEELKAAGEEVERAFPLEFDEDEENVSSFQDSEQEAVSVMGTDEAVAAAADEPKSNEETDLLKKIDRYQQRMADEQISLEQIYQEVKELKQKLENRIELLKKLQVKSKDFRDELALFQKEEDADSLGQRAEYLVSGILRR